MGNFLFYSGNNKIPSIKSLRKANWRKFRALGIVKNFFKDQELLPEMFIAQEMTQLVMEYEWSQNKNLVWVAKLSCKSIKSLVSKTLTCIQQDSVEKTLSKKYPSIDIKKFLE